jgi:hypothetical protein
VAKPKAISQVVKDKMVGWDGRLVDVEFATVANPYGTP